MSDNPSTYRDMFIGQAAANRNTAAKLRAEAAAKRLCVSEMFSEDATADLEADAQFYEHFAKALDWAASKAREVQ